MEASVQGSNRRALVRVHGIVQGVGFRPYIYQLAHKHRLGGWVCNQSDGVEIEVAGKATHVETFLRELPANAPPLARILTLDVAELEYSPEEAFRIVQSRSGKSRTTLISPDVCTCSDCLRELRDPSNRRHRYPFINCTNCGPRYTIIKDIPYDRDKTTMAPFVMCQACAVEYEDPMDRRFHAQPNACWECGPQVWLQSAEGERLASRDEAVRLAIDLLSRGSIMAIKGLGGFHLAVLATSEAAVSRLRSRKIREEKPFAVMFPGLEAVRDFCNVNDEEASLLESPNRPIVLLTRRQAGGGRHVAPAVAPLNRHLGAFLPYTPLHFLLFDKSPYDALVMTSGNQSDEPIVMSNEEAFERLHGIADYFLFHDRDIYMRCDDSVIRAIHGKPRSSRRARGYAPAPVFLRRKVPCVLGVGAELKNTVCLTRGNEAFLSQHIGDLENLETLRSFEHSIAHLERILEVSPECIVHDMHPDYLSTQWALSRKGLPCIEAQHHHAHIAAVVAEQRLSGPVLGLALDGTGYGPDSTIWGGEILLVEDDWFERLGHFRQVRLPGGSMAIREPWRMAVSYLWQMAPHRIEEEYGDILARWPRARVSVLLQMLERNVNSPLTSSCGRLFDTVSALVGLRDSVTYEGQAAIELEQSIEPSEESYRGELWKDSRLWILDPVPMLAEVVRDVRAGEAGGLISARFHNGLTSLLAQAAESAGEETGLKRIALSGGVFQNATLLAKIEQDLKSRGFQVFSHVEVPSNDACIALGQAHIGACRLLGRMKREG